MREKRGRRQGEGAEIGERELLERKGEKEKKGKGEEISLYILLCWLRIKSKQKGAFPHNRRVG